MKQYNALLQNFKNHVFAPLYLFHGPEEYIKAKALEALRANILAENSWEFNYVQLDGETSSPADIIAAANTSPFLGEKRLVVVNRPAQFKASPGKQETQENKVSKDDALLHYLAAPMDSTCLVFLTPDPVDKRKKIYKALSKYGEVMEFSFLKPNQLRQWLQKQATLAHKKIEPAAIEMLITRMGPHLTALHNELEKLLSYSANAPAITLEAVKQLTPIPLEENIFQVVDCIGNKKTLQALAGIRDLLLAKQSPQAILAMVARQFRLILQVKEAQTKGYAPEELAAATGLHPFVLKKIQSQAQGIEMPEAICALQLLHAMDLRIKTGQQTFPAAMEEFILLLGNNKSLQTQVSRP